MTSVDITNMAPSNYSGMCQWLIDNCGSAYQGDGIVLLSGDTWRIYKEENTVEGYYETTVLLEFDNDTDGTAFLLKWL